MKRNTIFVTTLLPLALVLLTGCPKNRVTADCYLNNILVRNGISISPASDSIPLGDTLWMTASLPRQARDNGNQPVDLDNKGVVSELRFFRSFVTTSDPPRPEDTRITMHTGNLTETRTRGTWLIARFQYATVADSLKLRFAFIPQKKGVYEISGAESFAGAQNYISSVFYYSGTCYQGIKYDSFINPNRHWYLTAGGSLLNYANYYFVKVY
jgi:hypothetical protein